MSEGSEGPLKQVFLQQEWDTGPPARGLWSQCTGLPWAHWKERERVGETDTDVILQPHIRCVLVHECTHLQAQTVLLQKGFECSLPPLYLMSLKPHLSLACLPYTTPTAHSQWGSFIPELSRTRTRTFSVQWAKVGKTTGCQSLLHLYLRQNWQGVQPQTSRV